MHHSTQLACPLWQLAGLKTFVKRMLLLVSRCKKKKVKQRIGGCGCKQSRFLEIFSGLHRFGIEPVLSVLCS